MEKKYDISKIPTSYRRDIEKAIKILLDEGCQEIYLFGSVVEGPVSPESDIDIAVKGIPSGSYFEIFARLMMQLDHPVDLIHLEKENRFGNMLQKEGYLHRVA
jgi:predicted nucleotidyltransferase